MGGLGRALDETFATLREDSENTEPVLCQEGSHPIIGKVKMWNGKPICTEHFGDYHFYFVDSFMRG